MATATLSSAVRITDAGLVWLDANAPLQAALISTHTPALFHQVLRRCFTWQQRNDTTIIQAALSADLSPMWGAALIAWNVQVLFDTGDAVSLTAYLKRASPAKGETIALLLPSCGENRRWGMADVARSQADDPIVGAVAVVDFDQDRVLDARLALTGVWKRTVALAQSPANLAGGPLNEEAIAAVADAIVAESEPRTDFLGSEDYRRAMAAVISRDALTQCMVV